MTLTDRVVKALGITQADLARTLQVHRSAISQWGDNIPPRRCWTLELMLKNTSDPMTRIDLRPDDWWIHWPDISPANKKVLDLPSLKSTQILETN